ncbi:Six-hairpin glycosidase [Hesseltinella vesiculosa]|uniref:glucan 1,4-alpha-glucosidase n=1 Tax=Hesseltinella vesiculosa TaxID=101127 RepID=A0A1X2GRX5_9FUNG|nr:Six-hairpin glycosidase [Hesseltinella vesiculosa]
MHVLSLAVASAMVLGLAQASPLVSRATCPTIDDALRMDCGTVASTQSSCLAAGCCYAPTSDGSPWCYQTTPVNSARPTPPSQSTVSSWVSSQYTYSVSALLNNLTPSGTQTGCVVAAQSKTNPNYWFHWARDSALTMDVVGRLYSQAVANKDAAGQAKYSKLMFDWIAFEQTWQSETNLVVSMTGNPDDNVGDAKANVDGTAFTGPWGRPQNDGPGLRIRTLVRFAGDYATATSNTTFAKSLSPMIAKNLNYIIRNYNNACTSGTPCIDLWEERSDKHWYTQISQRRGLVEGAYYMNTWGGNPTLASSATSTVSALEPMIESHWNATVGYIKEMQNTGDRNSPDAAIMLGAIQSVDSDLYMSPATDKVLATVFRYALGFKGKFKVNQDRQANAPAVGRYLEDVYNGADGNGAGPWLLATAGMAEFYYQAAIQFWQQGGAVVTSINKPIFDYFGTSATVGSTITGADLTKLVNNMAGEGDAYLDTLSHFMGSTQDMTEQFNPVTGARQGAPHLTWSYAAMITAKWKRDSCYAVLSNTPTPPTTTTSASTTTSSAGGSTTSTSSTTTSATPTATPSVCAVADSSRADCGYVGITQSICASRNCCWAPSSTSGTPWCFFSNPTSTTCAVADASRTDCGYVGITQSICASRNCCWSPTTDGTPWCFHALNL